MSMGYDETLAELYAIIRRAQGSGTMSVEDEARMVELLAIETDEGGAVTLAGLPVSRQ